jgi:aspartyl-tRNA(Asn)/glutamyl-tRNA(Gln) amidotransferase subunit C
MKVDKEIVKKVATLAKLSFTEEEQEKLASDMSRMTEYFELLNAIDTEGIEPLIYLSEEKHITREDIVDVDMSFSQQQALKNAPLADSDYFKVPKVIERE